ncbi:MAG: hypothetical protein KKB70_06220 [Proteobacteria bacterium]|nr:hypothetical protein [Pseudomonadota bacterium]
MMNHIYYLKTSTTSCCADIMLGFRTPELSDIHRHYAYVGSLDTASAPAAPHRALEAIFGRLNNIQNDTANEMAASLCAHEVSRLSMSVGDIVINETGVWLCAAFGWKNLCEYPTTDFSPHSAPIIDDLLAVTEGDALGLSQVGLAPAPLAADHYDPRACYV